MQSENIVECQKCDGAWRESDFIPESVTIAGAFYICPNCGYKIFKRYEKE